MSNVINSAGGLLNTVLNPVGAGLSAAAGALVGRPAQAGTALVEAPSIKRPPIMPLPNDAAVISARRRSIAQQMATRGRASTVLTAAAPTGEKLGV